MITRTLMAAALIGGCVCAATGCGDDGDGDAADATNPPADTAEGSDTTSAPDTSTAPDTSVAPDTSAAPDTATTDDTDTDTVAEDTIIVDPLEGTCAGVLRCVEDSCVALAGEDRAACVATCEAGAEAGEAEAFGALASCMEDQGCAIVVETDEDVRTQADCQRQNCRAETASCFGGDFGAADCAETNACFRNCEAFDERECLHACVSEATEEDASAWLNLHLCLVTQCYDSAGFEEDFELCAQQATQTGGLCKEARERCISPNIGAGPGAGQGGGRSGDGGEADFAR